MGDGKERTVSQDVLEERRYDKDGDENGKEPPIRFCHALRQPCEEYPKEGNLLRKAEVLNEKSLEQREEEAHSHPLEDRRNKRQGKRQEKVHGMHPHSPQESDHATECGNLLLWHRLGYHSALPWCT